MIDVTVGGRAAGGPECEREYGIPPRFPGQGSSCRLRLQPADCSRPECRCGRGPTGGSRSDGVRMRHHCAAGAGPQACRGSLRQLAVRVTQPACRAAPAGVRALEWDAGPGPDPPGPPGAGAGLSRWARARVPTRPVRRPGGAGCGVRVRVRTRVRRERKGLGSGSPGGPGCGVRFKLRMRGAARPGGPAGGVRRQWAGASGAPGRAGPSFYMQTVTAAGPASAEPRPPPASRPSPPGPRASSRLPVSPNPALRPLPSLTVRPSSSFLFKETRAQSQHRSPPRRRRG